jgi:hypothetical protein
MTTSVKTTVPAERKSPQFGLEKLVFAVVLAVVFFLLVLSMQRHRFFQGGHDHRSGHEQSNLL